jgi:tight adherence protein B
VRLGRALAAFVAGLTLPGAALGATEVRAVDASRYPVVSLTVVSGKPSAQAPHLIEDGQPVAGFKAENLGLAKSTVLAVDRSQSMKGKAIEDAIAAARAFVGGKPAADRISLTAFGGTAASLTGFSSSTIDVDTALRTLGVDDVEGTALYDAIVVSAGELASEPLPARAIVVMTDGRDVSSRASLDEAIAAAKEVDAAVYAIAIESPQFSPDALRRMAAETGGSYFGTASTAALGAAYRRIAGELQRTWRLEYVTAGRPGEELSLKALVAGDAATATVTVPGHAAPSIAGKQPSGLVPKAFLESSWAPQVLALVTAILVLVACAFLFSAPKGTWVRARLAPHLGSKKRNARQAGDRQRLSFVSVLFKATEQALGKKAFWRRLQRLLERGDVPLRAVEFAYLIAGCGLGAGIVAAGLRLQTLAILASMLVGAFIPYALVVLKARRRLRAFENQLPDLLVTMAASLKAGHSFRQGMQTVVDEGAEPASKEFKRVLTETQLGRSMDDALVEMADRIGSKDLAFAITSVTIQRQVGGSLAGLFDMIAETVRNRQQFGRKIKGLTSMGRASAYVLIGLPFFVALAITAINGEYMKPLWHTSTGQKLIFLGLIMMACGASMLKKIVSFRG